MGCPKRRDVLDIFLNAVIFIHLALTLEVGQPRAFLELHEFLLSLDLPDATRAAWGRFL